MDVREQFRAILPSYNFCKKTRSLPRPVEKQRALHVARRSAVLQRYLGSFLTLSIFEQISKTNKNVSFMRLLFLKSLHRFILNGQTGLLPITT